MQNPFLKRATDYFPDDEAFLSVVSPEPIEHFLGEYGEEGLLYDRLVVLQGTPGSGKTTAARLFQLAALVALLRNRTFSGARELLATLTRCGAVEDDKPAVLASRLAMETDYRDFWELPYSEKIRTDMLHRFVQARSILGWLQQLEDAGIDRDAVTVITKASSSAGLESAGAHGPQELEARARQVETALYGVIGALIPPSVGELSSEITIPYAPFDVVEGFRVAEIPNVAGTNIFLRPLTILDDAHALHGRQFRSLRRWLAKRELRIARWMLTRLDVLSARVALEATSPDPGPGIARGRDVIEVRLQSARKNRRQGRLAFRKMAEGIGDRYLAQIPLFTRRQLRRLRELWLTELPNPTKARLTKLQALVDSSREQLGITRNRTTQLGDEVDRYAPKGKRIDEDVRLMMLNIALHRFAKRTPQRDLFGDVKNTDSKQRVKIDAGVFDGARMQLFHRFKRPFYYGMDQIADASSENAEQFLRLAGALVEASADRLARKKSASLTPRDQHDILRSHAADLVEAWDFPEVQAIHRLTSSIAERCLAETLSPNAWLATGANAFGIPQSEFEDIPKSRPQLARVLQFGIAYNAFSITPNYECQKKTWCLIELGGLVLLKSGLTLHRGGFIKASVDDLEQHALGETHGST